MTSTSNASSTEQLAAKPESELTTRTFLLLVFLTPLLLFLSFPPVGFWWLAWLAPIPHLYLTQVQTLPGKRPFQFIWLSGLAYWLGTFYFVPYPHPALWLGWIVVSSYLAFYTLLFFVSTRQLYHVFHIPVVMAAPICWTGLEYVRMNFLTGMGLVGLSHSQYKQSLLIQCADLSGAYTLTFVMIVFSAALLHIPVLKKQLPRQTRYAHLSLGPIAIMATVVYGAWALSFETIEKDEAPVSIGIIQGSIDTRLNAKAEVQAEKFEQYTKLTWEARKQWPDLDVVLWPENGLPVGVYDLVMENRDAERIEWLNESRSKLKEFSRIATGAGLEFSSSVTMIVGGLSIDDQDNYYNSALLIDPSGRVGNRYYKTHRVMYGEYYPILNQIPGIKERLPEISRGTQPASFEVRNKNLRL